MIPPSCSDNLLAKQEVDYKTVRIFAREVKQKVWTEAENRERDWAETLKILSPHTPFGHVRPARLASVRLTPRFTDFFTDFEKKKTDCFAVYERRYQDTFPSEEVTLTIRDLQYSNV